MYITKVSSVHFEIIEEGMDFHKRLMDKIIKSIDVCDHNSYHYIIFHMSDGNIYVLFHMQDCCEEVYLSDITGSLDNLIGSPITMAEVATNNFNPPKHKEEDETHTWTFYKLATVKGYVTIRWCGISNGAYSEEVDFVSVENLNIGECK